MRCKFIDADGRTRAGLDGETQWGPGVSHSVEWSGKLCHEGVLHAYADPLLAVFCDPIDGRYLEKPGALLWRIEGTGCYVSTGLKEGWQTITTLEPIPIPAMSLSQRVEIAIRRSLDVYAEPSYIRWAYDWLDGRDRTAERAALAERAAAAERVAAAWPAETWAAARVPDAAAWAAEAETWAGRAAWVAWVAEAERWAAAQAARAAEAAETAEEAVSTKVAGARLLEIIYQVMEG